MASTLYFTSKIVYDKLRVTYLLYMLIYGKINIE